jgi:hypothetical protein
MVPGSVPCPDHEFLPFLPYLLLSKTDFTLFLIQGTQSKRILEK